MCRYVLVKEHVLREWWQQGRVLAAPQTQYVVCRPAARGTICGLSTETVDKGVGNVQNNLSVQVARESRKAAVNASSSATASRAGYASNIAAGRAAAADEVLVIDGIR